MTTSAPLRTSALTSLSRLDWTHWTALAVEERVAAQLIGLWRVCESGAARARTPRERVMSDGIAVNEVARRASRDGLVHTSTQLARRALAEFIGPGLLLIAVIGSGIAAQSLSPADTGLELLENAAATGAAFWWPSSWP